MKPLDFDHRQLKKCAFALIDPSQGDDEMWAPWQALEPNALVPKGYEARADEFPCLVDVNRLSSEQYSQLVALVLGGADVGPSSFCVGLLETSADVERVSRHMRRLLAPTFPSGEHGIFRFYDPVVFEHLDWMLDDLRRSALLGPMDAWIVPLRGAWQCVTNDVDPTRRVPAFLPGVQGWQRIPRIGAIYAVLEHDSEWQAAPAIWGPRAEALLVRAEQHQLSDRDDVVAFAVQGLRWHARLDGHPRVLALLTESSGHPKRYRRLSAKLTEADWQTIHDELEHPENLRIASSTTSHIAQGAYQ